MHLPFSIAHNYLSSEGAKYLAKALNVNSSMKTIKVNDCELPIATLETEIEVDLSGRNLRVEDAIIIAACINVSSSLNSLK